jgi:hypothetical protein
MLTFFVGERLETPVPDVSAPMIAPFARAPLDETADGFWKNGLFSEPFISAIRLLGLMAVDVTDAG